MFNFFRKNPNSPKNLKRKLEANKILFAEKKAQELEELRRSNTGKNLYTKSK